MDIADDLPNVVFACTAVSLYLILFLGSFTPIHCRCTVAIAGIISVALAFFATQGLLSFCGLRSSTFNLWLPVLLCFISLENMFSICGALDQTNLEWSAYTRLHNALSVAGPAITITTVTTCVAFAFGTLSSLKALNSFCIFACVCVVMLYFCSFTVFLSVVVWDTRRVQDRRKECLGACCCVENSLFCCLGKFASPKQ